MSQILGVAAVQMEVVSGDGNIERMEKHLSDIQHQYPWVQLVVFPELCIFGIDPKWAEPVPGKATEQLQQLAEKFNMWLVPGSMSEATAEGIYNTAVVLNPNGELIVKYRKMYPWRPLEKSLPGRDFCVFDIPEWGRIGLCICYDLWFPEVARQLAWMGAEAILCPTATTTPDRPLEVVLAQSHAITNQLYYVDVNGAGQGGNGLSLIVDPEGQVMARGETAEAILTAKLDRSKVESVRESGTLGQCQALKSYKDGDMRFPVYAQGATNGEGFKNLNAFRTK